MSRLEKVKEIISTAKEEGRTKLLEHEAYEVLKLYEIPVPKAGLARSEEDVPALVRSVGFPIVMKIVSPDIVPAPHLRRIQPQILRDQVHCSLHSEGSFRASSTPIGGGGGFVGDNPQQFYPHGGDVVRSGYSTGGIE